MPNRNSFRIEIKNYILPTGYVIFCVGSISSSPISPKFKHISGFDDLDEIKDKEAFFAQIENETEEVDYGKLNEEFDQEHEER